MTTYPGKQPNIMYLAQTFRNQYVDKGYWSAILQVLEYFDCFFKNMYKYKYIGVLDVDKVIVPTNGDNWMQMIDDLRVGLFKFIKIIFKISNFISVTEKTRYKFDSSSNL